MDDDAAIRDLIARYLAAYEGRDSAGCGAVYCDDAVVLSPWGPPVCGRSAVAAVHEDWFEAGESNKVMAVADLAVDGETGFCLVGYEADVPDGVGGTERTFGASLNVVRRQPDGAWLISHTSLNELEDSLLEPER